MALDPSIGLGFKPTTPFDPMGAATTGMKLAQMGQSIEESKQNILHSQAATATLDAQRPGLAAASDKLVGEMNLRKWLSDPENVKGYTDPETGQVDANKIIVNATKAGHYPFAAAAVKEQLANLKTQEDTLTQRATTDAGIATADKAKVELYNTAREGHANLLKGMADAGASDEDLAATAKKQEDALNTISPYRPAQIGPNGEVIRPAQDGLGTRIAAPMMKPVLDADNKPVIETQGPNAGKPKMVVDKAAINAVTDSTMTPAKKIELKISQSAADTAAGHLDVARNSAFMTSEGDDPHSAMMEAVREQYKAHGLTPPADNMTMRMLDQTGQKKFLNEVLSGTVITPAQRETMKTRVVEGQLLMKDLDQGIAASKKLEGSMGTIIGTLGGKAWNAWVGNDTDRQQVQTLIGAYNNDPRMRANPIDPGKQTYGEIMTALKTYRGIKEREVAAIDTMAKSGTWLSNQDVESGKVPMGNTYKSDSKSTKPDVTTVTAPPKTGAEQYPLPPGVSESHFQEWAKRPENKGVPELELRKRLNEKAQGK